jgi:tape measure domain-containing protein
MAKKNVTYVLSLEDRLSRPAANIEKNFRRLDKAAERTGSSITRFLGAAVLTIGVQRLGSEIIETTAEIQALNNAIVFASGTAQEGANNLQFIERTANDLGLSIRAAKEGFKTFSGATIGTNIQGDQTREIFESVSIAASAMGLSADNAKGTFIALGQILGKGKVQAEELRGQLGERIPGAFGIAARAMGVTTQELDKMLERGELLAEDFLPKFSKELRKTFEGAIPKSTKSLRANLNRLESTFDKLSIAIGTRFNRQINKGISTVSDFAKSLTSLVEVPLSESLRETRSELNAEFNLLKNANIPLDKRQSLIENINLRYGTYLENLLDEKSSLEDIEAAQMAANRSLIEKIKLSAKEEIIRKESQKLLELQKDLFEAQLKFEKKSFLLGGQREKEIKSRIKEIQEENQAILEQRKITAKEQVQEIRQVIKSEQDKEKLDKITLDIEAAQDLIQVKSQINKVNRVIKRERLETPLIDFDIRTERTGKSLLELNNELRTIRRSKGIGLPQAAKEVKELQAEVKGAEKELQDLQKALKLDVQTDDLEKRISVTTQADKDLKDGIQTEAKKISVGATADKDLKDGIQTIKGAAPKTFNINIENLVKEFTVSTTNLSEGQAEIKSKVVEAMAEALADVQPVVK